MAVRAKIERRASLILAARACFVAGGLLLLGYLAIGAWIEGVGLESVRALEAARAAAGVRKEAGVREEARAPGAPEASPVSSAAGSAGGSALPSPRSVALLAASSSASRRTWSASRIRAFEGAIRRVTPMPEGVLTIPSLRLRVPVFAGTSDAHLTIGAGHIEGTAPLDAPGNVGIASHRDGYFRALKDIEIGADIFVDTLQGRYRYEVVSTLIVDPRAVQVLAPTGHPALTLVTCYPFYFVGHAPLRYIVSARRVDADAGPDRAARTGR
ncbi:MAG TPA: class D sortase [Gammaproteobacteria bacterium]|nr:class D sortase [Gammaproteobacteria bacterium]